MCSLFRGALNTKCVTQLIGFYTYICCPWTLSFTDSGIIIVESDENIDFGASHKHNRREKATTLCASNSLPPASTCTTELCDILSPPLSIRANSSDSKIDRNVRCYRHRTAHRKRRRQRIGSMGLLVVHRSCHSNTRLWDYCADGQRLLRASGSIPGVFPVNVAVKFSCGTTHVRFPALKLVGNTWLIIVVVIAFW